MWEAGALPSAMDAVLSTLRRPAVVLIDIWRYKMPGATNDTASVHIDAEITARLDAFAAANVTVIAGSGATKQNLSKWTQGRLEACCFGDYAPRA